MLLSTFGAQQHCNVAKLAIGQAFVWLHLTAPGIVGVHQVWYVA